MPLRKRITIFAALWLPGGLLSAIFADRTVEAGESELLAHLQFVSLAPIVAALSVAFAVVHGHYDTWQQREYYEALVGWFVIALFAIHGIIALTRRTRRQFIALTAVQILFLAASVPCVLYFFHYEATRGHG